MRPDHKEFPILTNQHVSNGQRVCPAILIIRISVAQIAGLGGEEARPRDTTSVTIAFSSPRMVNVSPSSVDTKQWTDTFPAETPLHTHCPAKRPALGAVINLQRPHGFKIAIPQPGKTGERLDRQRGNEAAPLVVHTDRAVFRIAC